MADPEPQPHEVLVTIHATAVNRADLLQRRGGYDPPPGAPPYLGLEMAGVVAAVGPRAQGCAVGDRVCSILTGGGYAEAVAADPSYLMPLPEALSFTEGGGLPEVFLTAYVNLFMEAGLTVGETVLIHGGASGVGSPSAYRRSHFAIWRLSMRFTKYVQSVHGAGHKAPASARGGVRGRRPRLIKDACPRTVPRRSQPGCRRPTTRG